MPVPGLRYRDRGALRWVEMTDEGLVEHLPLRRARRMLWSQVRGVRWVRRGVAEVVSVDGRTIRLPCGRLLVDDVEARAEATQAEWRDQGLPPALLSERLGLAVDGELVYDPNAGPRALGWYLAAIALPLAAAGGWLLVAAMVPALLGLGLLVRSTVQAKPVVRATTSGLVVRHRCAERAVRWADVRGAEVTCTGRFNPQTHLRLETTAGALEVHGATPFLAPLVACAQLVADANTARFARAEAEPLPDTALSPARLSGEADAERGLSPAQEDA